MRRTKRPIKTNAIRKWREDQCLEIEKLKSALAADHNLDRNEKFEIAWRLAWDYGHSSGLGEVRNYFEELVPLLKP